MELPDHNNKSESPLITIGIPVYNVENYVEKCLLSALNQTYLNMEIIVVDDCGNDHSMQIVEKIKMSHANGKFIRIIKHSNNKGIGEARNTIIKACKGKYVYFIDSDDFIEPNAIELLCAQSEKYKTDVTIASHRKVAWETGTEMPTYQYSSFNYIHGKDAFANYVCADLRWHIAIVVWNILFLVDFLRNNNLLFAGRKDEDALFLSDYYSEVSSAIIMPDITYNYVARPDSIMGYMSRKKIPIREIHERFNTDSLMTERCARLRDRSFYDVHCARVMKHKFRAVCVALRHRKRFTETLPIIEIYKELRHPATLSEIISFNRYRSFNMFFYLIWKLPPALSVGCAYIVGKLIRWI